MQLFAHCCTQTHSRSTFALRTATGASDVNTQPVCSDCSGRWEYTGLNITSLLISGSSTTTATTLGKRVLTYYRPVKVFRLAVAIIWAVIIIIAPTTVAIVSIIFLLKLLLMMMMTMI